MNGTSFTQPPAPRPPQPNAPFPAQPAGWRRWLWPLRSRKVQVALATVIVAYAGEAGFALREETIATVVGVGVALILGIAYEDGSRRG